MNDHETISGEVLVYPGQLINGKLPRFLPCVECGQPARRLSTRTVPTYRCNDCDCTTTLELSEDQKHLA